MASPFLGVDTPNWWEDKNTWNDPWSCRTMERFISQKNTSPLAIGQRPLVSLVITNNLLAPSIKATDLGISPRATTTIAWNNFENLEDGSFGMKHPEKCSYTIPKNAQDDKWGAKAKAWVNKVIFRTKMCLGWKLKTGGRIRSEGGGVKLVHGNNDVF